MPKEIVGTKVAYANPKPCPRRAQGAMATNHGNANIEHKDDDNDLGGRNGCAQNGETTSA